MKWNWKWWKKKLPYYLDSRNDKVDAAYFQNAIPAAQWNNLIDYVSQISGGDLSSFELKEDHELDITRIDGLIEALESRAEHQSDIKAIVDQLNASKVVYENRFTTIEGNVGEKESITVHINDIAALNARIDNLPSGGGTGDVTKEMLDEAVSQLQTSINTKESVTNHSADISNINETMETQTAHAQDIQTILNTTNNLASKNELLALKTQLNNDMSNLEQKTDIEFNSLDGMLANKLDVVDMSNATYSGELTIPASITPSATNRVPYIKQHAYFILATNEFGDVLSLIIPRNYTDFATTVTIGRYYLVFTATSIGFATRTGVEFTMRFRIWEIA